MLGALEALFAELNRQGVRYCLWKKSALLEAKLQGRGDLDLLLGAGERPRFEGIVLALGFLPAVFGGARIAAIQHYFGLDGDSDALVHLDVCERLLAGGSLLENYDLPLGAMLFDNLEWRGALPVPVRGAELLLFLIRRLLAGASPLEQLLLYRDFGETATEIAWLGAEPALSEAEALASRYLPQVDPTLVRRGVAALSARSALIARWRLGRTLERDLAPYRLRPASVASLIRYLIILRGVSRRLSGRRRPLALVPHGMVIAVIGPDASGKSTLVRELGAWLGAELAVFSAHAGKPSASALTLPPRMAARLARRALTLTRSVQHMDPPMARAASWGEGNPRGEMPDEGLLAVRIIRALLLAADRWRLLRRAASLASRGTIVIFDRYPTTELGGVIDSAQLDPVALAASGHRLAALCARLENRIYRRMQPPDLVVRLRLSLAVALRRNAARVDGGGPEPEEYVIKRFARVDDLHFPRTQAVDVAAGGPRAATLLGAKRAIWSALAAGRER